MSLGASQPKNGAEGLTLETILKTQTNNMQNQAQDNRKSACTNFWPLDGSQGLI